MDEDILRDMCVPSSTVCSRLVRPESGGAEGGQSYALGETSYYCTGHDASASDCSK